MPAEQPPEPLNTRRARSFWVGMAGLALLLFVGIASMVEMAPNAPTGPDAPAGAFSAARAMTQISAIADEPRPIGSAHHNEVRTYLLDQLESLGWRTEVQESIGMFDFGVDGTQPIAAVANVIATRPGTASTGTVILAAHYDTVAGSPGAADDGIGVGVLLETARALSSAGAPRNTVMILLTDAEEIGLLGAEAFVRERASELGTAVVLNHEARGAGGAPMTFRMSSPNTELIEVLARAPGAFADSSSEATFEGLSNETDFTSFGEAGLHGYDTAITADSAYYHSPIDDPAHLSAASLQQMGDISLALTRELAGMDLSTVRVGGEQIVTTLPWGLLWYPQSLEIPFAIALLVLTIVLAWVLRRRGSLTLPRVVLSAAAATALLVVAGAASFAVWRLALLIDPAQASAVVGEPYRPVLYRVGMLLAGLAAVLSVFALVRRWLSGVLAVGMLVALGLVAVLLAFTLPGVSGAVVQPALVVAIGGLVAVLVPERRTAARSGVYLLALAVAAMMLGPAVWMGFDIGLNAGPLSAVLLAVFATLALPLIESVWPVPADAVPRRKLRIAAVPILLVMLTAAFWAAGLVANREGATDPRQEAVAYSLDADTKKALWASGAAPASDWSRSLLSEPATPLEDAFPVSAGSALWYGPAPAADLPPPAVTVLRDVNRGDTRELTLRLSSRRGASTLGLWVDAGAATVRSASVADRDIPTDRSQGKWSLGFRFYGAPRDGVEVRLQLDQHATDVRLRVADSTHDFSVVPGFTPPQGRVLVTPEVVVTRTVTL